MENNKTKSISLGGFNELIKMRDGWMVYNKNDVYIGRSIKEYGEWSQGEINLCKQILNPNDLVIEVGSNIGSHTLAIAKIVNKGAVFSFEPQNIIFQNLCANISINSITNCFCFQSALSDVKDEELYYPYLDFSIENNFGAMSLFDKKSKNSLLDVKFLRVPVDTLDDKFSNLTELKLIKTDAEEMEINVFKGGINLLKRTKPFLYFENNGKVHGKSQELIEFLWSLDYRLFWHVVPMFNKKNFFKNTNNIFGKLYSCNMFAIRKDQEINIDLAEVKDSSYHPFRG